MNSSISFYARYLCGPDPVGGAAPAPKGDPDSVERAARLLLASSRQGIRLWMEGDRLRCSAPLGALDEELRRSLQAERDGLIALLSERQVRKDRPAKMQPGRPPTLTLAQEALLPLARGRWAEGIYNLPLVLEIDGIMEREVLEEALQMLFIRHHTLRTFFPNPGKQPEFLPLATGISAEETWEEPGDGEAVEAAIREAIARPFDLSRGPLWRYGIFRSGKKRTLLLFVFHHLVFDGFSRDVFLAELTQAFSELKANRPVSPSPSLQVSDFAAWERLQGSGPRAEAARVWWRERFTAPCPSTALPAGVETQPPRSRSLEIPARLAASFRRRASSSRLPTAALAMTVGLLALHRMTGQTRIVFMTPWANREEPETKGILGYLNRVLPISVGLQPDATPATLAARLAREVFEAGAHGFLSTSEIVGLPGLARTQLNRLLISWQERRRGPLVFGRMKAREVSFGRHGADFGLALQFEADGDRLSCRIDQASGVLGDDGQKAFADLLIATMEAVVGPGWNQKLEEATPRLQDAAAITSLLSRHPGVKEAYGSEDFEEGLTKVWMVLHEDHFLSDADFRLWLRQPLRGLVPPIRWMTCASLPRTFTGAVNVEALPTSPPLPQGAEPPASDLERLIADLWRKNLWLDRPVGRHEDFRMLGGHSLLAVRIITELEAKVGRPFGSRAMRGLSTVAALAETMERPEAGPLGFPASGILDAQILARLRVYTASWKGNRPFEGALIVGRNLEGRRPPLFWCLQNETELDQLSRYIGGDQPVFGMRSGHAVMVKSRENIDQLARHYSEELLRTAPSGPFFLGGNCQAAVIAFRVAKHLEAAGRQVALLVLHEKMIPESYDGRLVLSFGRESARNPYRLAKDPRAEFKAFYPGSFSIDLVSGAHGQFFQEPHILDFISMIQKRRDETPQLAPQRA